MSVPNSYETDFYAWTIEQVTLLHNQQWQQLDLENLIEEITSLGKQQRQELPNRLSILLAHLLKWEYQPQKRSRSWLATIRVQRRDVLHLLRDNSSLKSYLQGETNLPEATFPKLCPYDFGEIQDESFYPGISSDLVSNN